MSIEQLKRQRGAIKAKLTTARNFASRINEQLEGTTKEEILRLQNLTEVYNRYQTISQQLSAISEEEYDQAEDQEFEDRYFAIRGSMSQYLGRLNPSSQASTASGGSQASKGTLAQVLEQQLLIF